MITTLPTVSEDEIYRTMINISTSPTYQAIDRAFSAPAPTLRYLTSADVYNLNDLLELASGAIAIVGYSPLYRPGQPVSEYDVKWHGPRRYCT